MKDNITDINDKFLEINNMGWIKSDKGRKNNFGRTFERLIGKEADNLEFPDYENIEIKARKMNAKNEYITLFSYKPESIYIDFIESLKNNYGYPDKNNRNIKVLNQSVFANKRVWIGSQFQFLLKIDEYASKIFLCVFDSSGILIEKEAYWDINTIKEKIERKLSNLAVVIVEQKVENDIEYYRYKEMQLYKLREFINFIDLIKTGKIRVNFKIGYFNSGQRINQVHNRGISFDLNYKNITELFQKI